MANEAGLQLGQELLAQSDGVKAAATQAFELLPYPRKLNYAEQVEQKFHTNLVLQSSVQNKS